MHCEAPTCSAFSVAALLKRAAAATFPSLVVIIHAMDSKAALQEFLGPARFSAFQLAALKDAAAATFPSLLAIIHDGVLF